MAGSTDVDEYLAALPDERRAAMASLRRAIRLAAPDATETIAYGMPAFRSHGGRFLLSFDAYKRHYSLFPASEAIVAALGPELEPYLSGKGTLRFPATEPIPEALVSRIVEIRVAETAGRGGRRGLAT